MSARFPWKQKASLAFLLGNQDDPLPPADFMPTAPEWERISSWYLRNPAHGLTHYVIGLRDRWHVTLIGTARNWKPGGGWHFHLFRHAFPFWLCPFISYWKPHGWSFYIGWRENGPFGARFPRKVGETP